MDNKQLLTEMVRKRAEELGLIIRPEMEAMGIEEYLREVEDKELSDLTLHELYNHTIQWGREAEYELGRG